MAKYRPSERAAADIAAIADFGIERFGYDQATRYRDLLQARLSAIAQAPYRYPKLRNEDVPPGTRFCPVGGHTVYFVPEADGVLVLRVLGRQRREFV